jgi:hypothetical protein
MEIKAIPVPDEPDDNAAEEVVLPPPTAVTILTGPLEGWEPVWTLGDLEAYKDDYLFACQMAKKGKLKEGVCFMVCIFIFAGC